MAFKVVESIVCRRVSVNFTSPQSDTSGKISLISAQGSRGENALRLVRPRYVNESACLKTESTSHLQPDSP